MEEQQLQSKLKILFIDDHIALRNAIGTLLSQINNRFEFYYATDSKEGDKQLLENPKISIALIDLNLGGNETGLSALKSFRTIKPDLKAIVFTMYSDPIHIEAVLKAGVQGYITKNAEVEEIERTILTVAENKTCFNKVASKIMQTILSPDSIQGDRFSFRDYKSLTKKEQEVFLLLAQQKEPEEISLLLNKKLKTVLNQRSIIYQKLNCKDRFELIEFAKKIGVLF